MSNVDKTRRNFTLTWTPDPPPAQVFRPDGSGSSRLVLQRRPAYPGRAPSKSTCVSAVSGVNAWSSTRA